MHFMRCVMPGAWGRAVFFFVHKNHTGEGGGISYKDFFALSSLPFLTQSDSVRPQNIQEVRNFSPRFTIF